jgi:hypothetical protein
LLDKQDRVASNAPGRMRLGVTGGRVRDRGNSELNPSSKERWTAPRHWAEVDRTSRIVLVHSDQGAFHPSTNRQFYGGAGMQVGETIRGLETGPESSCVEQAIVSRIASLDLRVAALSRYQVDLKLLFPLVPRALGVLRHAGHGTELGYLPSHVFVCYVFDWLRTFHFENERNR